VVLAVVGCAAGDVVPFDALLGAPAGETNCVVVGAVGRAVLPAGAELGATLGRAVIGAAPELVGALPGALLGALLGARMSARRPGPLRAP
jgi:hypothetical protein